MKYMLLLYIPADVRENEAVRAPMEAWMAYRHDLERSDALVAGDALQGLATATTVRERSGDRVITDGPYAETKEMLGGYFLIDVPDLDAALSWAERCPGASTGVVEVRPIWEM